MHSSRMHANRALTVFRIGGVVSHLRENRRPPPLINGRPPLCKMAGPLSEKWEDPLKIGAPPPPPTRHSPTPLTKHPP